MKKTYVVLKKNYGPQGWWPVNGKYKPGRYDIPRNDRERFEICIGAILTQNTSWKNVEKALTNLRKERLLSAHSIIQSKNLPEIIKPAGYYNQKARKLREFAKFYISLKGKTPTREALLAIWGIGPETADSILLYAYHEPVFVIDTYTRRLFQRLGIIKGKETYQELQDLCHSQLPKDSQVYKEYHALIVEHGKRHGVKKALCQGCSIACEGKLYKKQK